MQLRRAFPADDLDGSPRQLEKALIGALAINGQQLLLAKLATQENLTSGCILRLPCFCQLVANKATKLCPVRIIWAAIRHRAGTGQLLFQSITRRNFDRAVKAVLARMGTPSADRYSSRGFLRGASQDLKETGTAWSVVAPSGLWRSPAFRGYLGMSKDVDRGVSQLFAVEFDSDSADEEPSAA